MEYLSNLRESAPFPAAYVRVREFVISSSVIGGEAERKIAVEMPVVRDGGCGLRRKCV